MNSDNLKNNADNQQERLINKISLENLKEEIIKLYNQNLSIRAIAKKIDCSSSGVKRILSKYKVPMRNKCESLNLCPKEFTEEEFQIVLGTMLGDGHFVKQKTNGESQLYIGHGLKQEEYIKWKYKKLERFIGCKIYKLYHHLKYKGEIREYQTLNFITRKSKLFTNFRDIFYDKEGIKVFPKEFIYNNLTPLSLAIWFMDDGGYVKSGGITLETQSFSYKENLEILNMFYNKFNINGKIKEVKNKKFHLTFEKEEKMKLKEIIGKYFLQCLRYKID